MMKKFEKMQKKNNIPKAMERCLMIRGGTVPLSPSRTWTYIHIARSTAKSTSSSTIRQLPQVYLLPPHWRAKSKHIIQGTSTRVPIKSNFSRKYLTLLGPFILGSAGKWTKRMRTTNVMPPSGRLIQKHHPKHESAKHLSHLICKDTHSRSLYP